MWLNMEAKSLSHRLSILKVLFESGKKLTATDFNISNANQYFRQLEKQGFIKNEIIKSNGVYLRYVPSDVRSKVREHLEAHKVYKKCMES